MTFFNKNNYKTIMNWDFIPDRIINREEQKRILKEWNENGMMRNLIIESTESGTGKTTLTKWFMKNKTSVNHYYVLCRGLKSEQKILRAITELILDDLGIDKKGARLTDTASILTFLRKFLNVEKKEFVIILDEVENTNNVDDLMNNILHLQREVISRVPLILITNDPYLTDKFSYITKSRLIDTKIMFTPYEVSEGVEILKFYIREHNIVDTRVVPDDNALTINLTKFVRYANTGDMRSLLNYFSMWMERCEKIDSPFNIDLLDDSLTDEIFQNDTLKILNNSVNRNELLVLTAIIKMNLDVNNFLKTHNKKGYNYNLYSLNFEKLKRYYEHICKNINAKPLSNSRIRLFLFNLKDKANLIMWHREGIGRAKGIRSYYYPLERVDDNLDAVLNYIQNKLGISKEFILNESILLSCSKLIQKPYKK
jgi:Cdc6-like AAA superfamily ATPase